MRNFCLMLTAAMVLMLLCGCNILETDNPPTLPKLNLDSSTLTCTVDAVNEGSCRVTVVEGDSHFDGPYENSRGETISGDTLHITYAALSGADSLSVGDSITFTYRYTMDVSEKNGNPHITVDRITVK